MGDAQRAIAAHRQTIAREICRATGRRLDGLIREYAELTALEHKLVLAANARQGGAR